MAYLAEAGETFDAARLEQELQRLANPAEREWLQDDLPFYGHVLCNLARNCHHAGREVPAWLESAIADLPIENVPIVFDVPGA